MMFTAHAPNHLQNKKSCRDTVDATSPISWFGEHEPPPPKLGEHGTPPTPGNHGRHKACLPAVSNHQSATPLRDVAQQEDLWCLTFRTPNLSPCSFRFFSQRKFLLLLLLFPWIEQSSFERKLILRGPSKICDNVRPVCFSPLVPVCAK